MARSDLPRRRSPGWVRAMSSREIHAVAFRFNWERQEGDLSEPQEWLYDALVSELEYRRRNARWPESRCSCELCVNPFDFDAIGAASDAE